MKKIIPIIVILLVLIGAYKLNQVFDSKFSFGLEHDNTLVENSPYMGQRIELLPNVLLVKMKNWGRWKDDFLYVYDKVPVNLDKATVVDSKKNSAATKFRVIEVRYSVDKSFGKTEKCILENESVEEEKIILECVIFKENLNHLEKLLISFPEYDFVRVIN